MYKSIVIVLLASLLLGCSSTRKIDVPSAGVTVIDYDANRRGSYILKTSDGKQVIVSEPSPDVAKEITASLGLSAETFGKLQEGDLQGEYANNVVDLASRSQTLQVLREALYRLSEIGVSSQLPPEQIAELYSKVLDTVVLMAATEFADSDADADSKKDLLKRLDNVGTGTVVIPE